MPKYLSRARLPLRCRLSHRYLMLRCRKYGLPKLTRQFRRHRAQLRRPRKALEWTSPTCLAS
jgi:hypothetical protein